ncbi:LPS export ABC transporter periplasmic protein LptC [Magnetospirillum sp. UT-4]|uniref:LPS export ABC transporter periplasmic protein LptC n=1 Tax=Magnetospirillum sp. UT-4 TaxID=2681467 RepID=UPI00137F3230|nr:LPS export ABC transporter periplasmic protein LptC [Magnetospirillum sp. UT-4]CAA7624650.1 conserved hypothetical protein [Magnetospirillum sp. UT-4]
MDLRAPADLRPTRRSRVHPVRPGHHRYSRFVVVMKVLLPSLAVVLLALVAVWPQLRSEEGRFRIGFADLSPDKVQALSMVNARYYGVDSRNRPFTITADSGTEVEARKGVIELEAPKADFSSRDGSGVYIEAKSGIYYEREQLLDLSGDVALYHDQGYELHTQSARIDLGKSTAEGTVPVTGNGPQGRIDGEGFRIEDSGRQVLVLGRSAATMKGAGRK